MWCIAGVKTVSSSSALGTVPVSAAPFGPVHRLPRIPDAERTATARRVSFAPVAAPLVLTFDNLGEAAALEAGTWRGTRIGEDPSVTVALPRLLDLLDELGLRATFFVEAWNVEHYPDAIREIADRGHEVGAHAWRHERWSALPFEDELRIIAGSREAFASLGIEVHGFRPPGGVLNAGTPALLVEHGLTWCSALRTGHVEPDGLTALPFDWSLVDATYVYRGFGGLRRDLGLPEAPLEADAMERHVRDAMTRSAAPTVLILHPFLALDDAVWSAHVRVLRSLADRGDVVRGCDLVHAPPMELS
jgi:peptidoglycan/xylan/chitin deacetylase (PgdA/CDA1 family)